MVVALPPADPDRQLTPLLIKTKDPYDATRIMGGEVRVISVEPARWVLRFEGAWPDGWDGCVTGSPVPVATCPDPLPW